MARKGFDYEAYKKWYYKQEQVNLKAGKPMYTTMYNYQEAKLIYDFTKEDLLDDVHKGKRGSVGNVYQYMAREQQAELSYKRTKAVYQYVKATGQDISFKELRYMTKQQLKNNIDWSYLEVQKQIWTDRGWDITKINKQVSINYYGSDGVEEW